MMAMHSTGLPLAFGGASLVPPAVASRAERLLDRAWDLGIRTFDTAAIYGDCELLLGRWLRRRPGARIISKCGHHEVLADGSLRSLRITMADVDRALARLGVERIDAMLLHSYDPEPLIAGEAVAVLRSAQAVGKIGAWGYSGDNATAALAMGIEGAGVLETSLSLADQANLDVAIALAAQRGALVMSKRSLANAAWKWRADPGLAPDHPREYALRLARMGLDPLVCGCSSWSELALRFAISCPGVGVAIVGCSDEDRLAENAAAARRGPLASATVAGIRDAFARARGTALWPGLN
jgi:aryl-alcohol dehydrogenase-like predicted oxidoreductase